MITVFRGSCYDHVETPPCVNTINWGSNWENAFSYWMRQNIEYTVQFEREYAGTCQPLEIDMRASLMSSGWIQWFVNGLRNGSFFFHSSFLSPTVVPFPIRPSHRWSSSNAVVMQWGTLLASFPILDKRAFHTEPFFHRQNNELSR